jgi:hypothetical protein
MEVDQRRLGRVVGSGGIPNGSGAGRRLMGDARLSVGASGLGLVLAKLESAVQLEFPAKLVFWHVTPRYFY